MCVHYYYDYNIYIGYDFLLEKKFHVRLPRFFHFISFYCVFFIFNTLVIKCEIKKRQEELK
jgi:hypothetical protein